MSTRRWFVGMVIGAMTVAPALGAMGAEHGGKEHAGKEHGGTTPAPSATTPSAAAPSAAAPAATTQEHGGKEHGGAATTQEHGGASTTEGAKLGEFVLGQDKLAAAEPTAEQIRQAIRDYIAGVEQEEGAFTVEDEATGAARTLTLVQVHERVGKTGEAYYSCTDMTDTATGELLDLDFDVMNDEGLLDVVDMRIHKVNGQPRYTYDDQDNRIPLM